VQFYAKTGQMDNLEETSKNLEKELNDWLTRIGDARPVSTEEEPLFGSWHSFNVARLPMSALSVAVANAAAEFAENDRFPAAERLFRLIWNQGQTLNDYCSALFLQSCWRNRHDTDEIVRLLDESQSLTAEYLIEVAPQMADVVRKGRPDLG
jgi:hypothetical protein